MVAAFTIPELRDLFQGCTILYYNLFTSLESDGVLDVDDTVHLFCLHYVYIKRINSSLVEFRNVWN